jgi:hypothetical protein
LLDRFPKVEGVGPMLRIQDLPFGHPALGPEIAKHWQRKRSMCRTSFGQVGVSPASLIGSFALCRADDKLPRPESGLRVHHPFDARNLDWMETGARFEGLARRLYW